MQGGKGEEDKLKRIYTKVFLYAYPWMAALGEAMERSAENKAMLSYRAPTAEGAALSVVTEYAMGRAVTELYGELGEIVSALDEEEKFLLGYKYFHARQARKARRLPYSERTYFRKQNALLEKVAGLLGGRGWTDARFVAEFGGFSPFLKILRALRQGRERAVWEKRKKSGTLFQNSARSGS